MQIVFLTSSSADGETWITAFADYAKIVFLFFIVSSGSIISFLLVNKDFVGWMRWSIVTRFLTTTIIKSNHTMASPSVRYLGQEEAIQLDQVLFNDYKFTLEQLMELAGLSVATAAYRVYGESHKTLPILAVAGPGNNGGDAIVAVRHMKMFGFENVTLLNTRPPTKEFFQSLVTQAEKSGVKIVTDPTPFLEDLQQKPSLVIDGLFGFSFKPPIRPDLQPFIQILSSARTLLSIDIPSGWDVEKGPMDQSSLMPQVLVSLSAPKKCASYFKGSSHFLGGRFLPKGIQEKYELSLPTYPGTDCIVQLS